MEKYQKIQSIWKRYTEGERTGQFVAGSFTRPEFSYLWENEWIGTEKIDGMNIRAKYDSGSVEIRGRTDRAQIPKHLEEYLEEIFELERVESVIGDTNTAIFFGEGFGNKIQRGQKYLGESVGFCLFDVMIGKWWLKYEDLVGIAGKLKVYYAPMVYKGSLKEAVKMVQRGFRSSLGDTDAEGLVLKPIYELFDRGGERIVTKIKTKDFK